MYSLGIKQLVNSPTRIIKDNKTQYKNYEGQINLVFANNIAQVHAMHEPKITDHAWIKIALEEIGRAHV